MPGQVRITDQLPLTAVGKVYKLPLIYEQVVRTSSRAELRGIEGQPRSMRAEGTSSGARWHGHRHAQPGKARLEAAIHRTIGQLPGAL